MMLRTLVLACCIVMLNAHYVQKFSIDPQRPRYHFYAGLDWMNDPNGPFFYNGLYHMFYQYCPGHVQQDGAKVWGHAASKDMIHWQWLPIALYPDTTADRSGVWSGSAVFFPQDHPMYKKHPGPVLIYTGIDDHVAYSQVQNLAFPSDLSDPFLVNWTKSEMNPIVDTPPNSNVNGFRDPTLFFNPLNATDGPYMLLGYGQGPTAQVSSFRGDVTNLVGPNVWESFKWSESGIFFEDTTYNFIDCPDFFFLSNNYSTTYDPLAVLVSGGSTGIVHIYFGAAAITNSQPRFTSLTRAIPIDRGNNGLNSMGVDYAVKSFTTPDGRRIMFGWVQEMRNNPVDFQGMLTLPREVYVRPTGLAAPSVPFSVGYRPAVETQSLRASSLVDVTNYNLTQSSSTLYEDRFGSTLELRAEFVIDHTTTAQTFGFWVRSAGDLAPEYTSVQLLWNRTMTNETITLGMEVDLSKSTQNPSCCRLATSFVDFNVTVNTLDKNWNTTVVLHVFVDNSIVEAFGNYQEVITTRIYPTSESAVFAGFFATGGHVNVKKVEIWSLQNLWH